MSFKDIKGQDRQIEILQRYITEGRLKGGYLFIGPDGIGKKLLAETLAKAVNCEEKPLDSCDRCSSCLKIDKNEHPDVHIIDDSTALTTGGTVSPAGEEVKPETNQEKTSDAIKIEYIRQLQNDISLKPYEARSKVFIIDNAHRLTAEAQNALLKILEEPPENSIIILTSDKPQLLFKTIISRCKILKFYPLVRSELKEFFKKEYSLDNVYSHFLAYFSEGRLGQALRLKDTDILREKNRIIDNFALSPRVGWQDLSLQDKEKVRSSINILAAWFRDIYLIKVGMPHSEIINLDRKVELLKMMSRFSFSDLNEILVSLSDSILYLEQNINIKLLLYNLGGKIWKE